MAVVDEQLWSGCVLEDSNRGANDSAKISDLAGADQQQWLRFMRPQPRALTSVRESAKSVVLEEAAQGGALAVSGCGNGNECDFVCGD